ncbi:hypothetical protein [Rodentibacter pneumotropicus]|uniref:Uncharacterized protein n=1 Tax=Rodentibacter pneumotropicus TaxID=758 RepID=A0A4S2QJD0_9PAST|nr:hypothetical protein [Rodentibacter pneumotropicus]THA09400.1 hypothetical protein D3M77_01965 [Rodentibacter pneumotropicus]THA17368.1 hypothetical protein D3M76_01610 [Rodentibacter pneumotropicus]
MVNKEKNTGKTKSKKTSAQSVKSELVERLVDNGTEIADKLWETRLGRPRKFDPNFAIQVMEEEIIKFIENEGKEGQYWETLPSNSEGGIVYKAKPFKTVGAIALMCGVDITTFLRHVNEKNEDGSLKNKQLYQSYKAFKDLGQTKLIEGGAAQAYSPNYVAFVGNVNYGMIPKQQVESTVEIKSMDKVYAELDSILSKGEETKRVTDQKAEMEARKALLDAEDEKIESEDEE